MSFVDMLEVNEMSLLPFIWPWHISVSLLFVLIIHVVVEMVKFIMVWSFNNFVLTWFVLRSSQSSLVLRNLSKEFLTFYWTRSNVWNHFSCWSDWKVFSSCEIIFGCILTFPRNIYLVFNKAFNKTNILCFFCGTMYSWYSKQNRSGIFACYCM